MRSMILRVGFTGERRGGGRGDFSTLLVLAALVTLVARKDESTVLTVSSVSESRLVRLWVLAHLNLSRNVTRRFTHAMLMSPSFPLCLPFPPLVALTLSF